MWHWKIASLLIIVRLMLKEISCSELTNISFESFSGEKMWHILNISDNFHSVLEDMIYCRVSCVPQFRLKIFRVYSHLSCLVWLNRTRVRFSSWCGSFGQVWIQQSHSVHTKQPHRDPAEEMVSVQTNSGTVECMNQWMDDLMHMYGFVLVHVQKGKCESEPQQTKTQL